MAATANVEVRVRSEPIAGHAVTEAGNAQIGETDPFARRGPIGRLANAPHAVRDLTDPTARFAANDRHRIAVVRSVSRQAASIVTR